MKKLFRVLFSVMLTMTVVMAYGTIAFADTVTDSLASVSSTATGLAAYSAVVIGILGALVFVTQVIVQVTKELPGINKIPTKLWVFGISLVVSIIALFVCAAVAGISILWYYVVLAVFAGFVVAYIAINGWDSLKDLYNRYVSKT